MLITRQFLQRIVPHSPWRGFRFYCKQLALKVNKSENSHNQQFIAGVVAALITFAPLWLIIWLFESLVAVPVVYQAFLLYLALGDGSSFKSATAIAKSVTNNDNYTSKQLLGDLVLRDTSSLSSLGINKATIEMQTLKHFQGYIAPVFWFILVGPIAAISYRLVLEMHYSWNVKLPRFHRFGWFANRVSSLLQWPASRLYVLFALLLVIGQQFILIWRLAMGSVFKLDNSFLLFNSRLRSQY